LKIGYHKSVALFCTGIFAMLMLHCSKPSVQNNTRTFRMGFANSAPRLDYNLYMQSLQSWTARADAAIISGELPWDSLLAGQSAQQYILQNYLPLANYFRSKNLRLWIYLDPENGLNRSSDANALIALGKSIADSDIQTIYTQFAWAMDSMLKPAHLGLAMETNLIRASAPASVYNGVRLASNNAASYVRAHDNSVSLGISIQAETAWGLLTGTSY
jgi:hypothetical protein